MTGQISFIFDGENPTVSFDGVIAREAVYEQRDDELVIHLMLDTREAPEAPDIILPDGTWAVVDQRYPEAGKRASVVARFKSLAEAEAAIVGLEYVDPEGVRNGGYGIDSPPE